MDLATRTASTTGESTEREDMSTDDPRIVVALEGRRPWVPGLRLSLRDLDEIEIGRGARREIVRSGRSAVLTIPDRGLSRQHVRLRRQLGGWELLDAGSKNGTMLNAGDCANATLADGDVIEAAAVMLVFREEASSTSAAELGDRDLAAEERTPLAFRTLSTELEATCGALARIAPAAIPVLIRGATGTGKELAARAIHERSARPGAFVAINCGALPRGLVESELFGHARGAFTGAREDREGLVRRAHRGTLFLDEIAELPPDSQAALLRVLQEGEVRPIGGGDPVAIDVRIVAATHQDLERRIEEGVFRLDLLARLAGFEVGLPPLRERREDIGSLIAAMLPLVAEASPALVIHRLAARALLRYPFPRNVRELEQTIRAAVVLAGGGEIRLEHLAAAVRTWEPPAPSTLEDRAFRERLVEILRQSRGNVAAVGREMKRAPVQIRRWCRRFDIDLSAFRR